MKCYNCLIQILILCSLMQPAHPMQNVLNYIQNNKKPVAASALGIILLSSIICKAAKYVALKTSNRYSSYLQDKRDRLLFTAIENNQPEKVVALLAQGADVNARITFRTHPETTNLDLFVFRFTIDTQIRKAPLRLGETSLMLAIKRHNQPMTELLLKAGADPLLATPQNITPLMVAAYSFNLAAIKLLINHIRTVYGTNPLKEYVNQIYSIASGVTRVYGLGAGRYIEKNDCDFTALFFLVQKWKEYQSEHIADFVRKSFFECIELLLRSGANINYMYTDLSVGNMSTYTIKEEIASWRLGAYGAFGLSIVGQELLKFINEVEYSIAKEHAEAEAREVKLGLEAHINTGNEPEGSGVAKNIACIVQEYLMPEQEEKGTQDISFDEDQTHKVNGWLQDNNINVSSTSGNRL